MRLASLGPPEPALSDARPLRGDDQRGRKHEEHDPEDAHAPRIVVAISRPCKTAAMMRGLVCAALLVVLATACGRTTTTTVTVTTAAAPTTTGRVPVSPAPMAITVFRVENGLLRPQVEHVPSTGAVATAALGALGLGGPKAIIIANGTADVAITKPTQDEEAEIVYTLTQFASIKRVNVGGRTGLTRDDFASYVPPILVESPAAGADVARTFHVSGTASVFEATLVVQLVRDGKVLEKQSVTASEGAPGRGTFDATFTATPGDLTIKAFAPSAEDGSPQHEVDVAVTVKP